MLTSRAEVLVVKYLCNAGRFFKNTTQFLVTQFCNVVTMVSHLGAFTFLYFHRDMLKIMMICVTCGSSPEVENSFTCRAQMHRF